MNTSKYNHSLHIDSPHTRGHNAIIAYPAFHSALVQQCQQMRHLDKGRYVVSVR